MCTPRPSTIAVALPDPAPPDAGPHDPSDRDERSDDGSAGRADGATDASRHHERDRGQATTEYALVLLAAALVGLLVVAWATSGGGAGRIGALFDRVVEAVMSRV